MNAPKNVGDHLVALGAVAAGICEYVDAMRREEDPLEAFKTAVKRTTRRLSGKSADKLDKPKSAKSSRVIDVKPIPPSSGKDT